MIAGISGLMSRSFNLHHKINNRNNESSNQLIGHVKLLALFKLKAASVSLSKFEFRNYDQKIKLRNNYVLHRSEHTPKQWNISFFYHLLGKYREIFLEENQQLKWTTNCISSKVCRLKHESPACNYFRIIIIWQQ